MCSAMQIGVVGQSKNLEDRMFHDRKKIMELFHDFGKHPSTDVQCADSVNST